MHYIVGLGNPGAEYETTRHNAGRIVLAHLMDAHHFPKLISSARYAARIAEGTIADTPATVAFPETYMNASGSAVAKLVTNARDAKRLIVVYDDIDLPLGSVRIATGRGSGGHRGVADIIASLGTKDFVRLRVGVAPVSIFGTVRKPRGEERVVRFLLNPMRPRELRRLTELGPYVSDIIEMIVKDGPHAAMNRYNTRAS